MTAAGTDGAPVTRPEATRAVLLHKGHGHRRHAADGALHAGIGAAGVGATALLAAQDGLSALERDVFEAVNGLPQTASRTVGRRAAGSFPAVFVTAGSPSSPGGRTGGRPGRPAAPRRGCWRRPSSRSINRAGRRRCCTTSSSHGPSATGLGFPSGHAGSGGARRGRSPRLPRRGAARVAGWVVVLLGLVALARILIERTLAARRAGRPAAGLDRRQRHELDPGHARQGLGART